MFSNPLSLKTREMVWASLEPCATIGLTNTGYLIPAAASTPGLSSVAAFRTTKGGPSAVLPPLSATWHSRTMSQTWPRCNSFLTFSSGSIRNDPSRVLLRSHLSKSAICFCFSASPLSAARMVSVLQQCVLRHRCHRYSTRQHNKSVTCSRDRAGSDGRNGREVPGLGRMGGVVEEHTPSASSSFQQE